MAIVGKGTKLSYSSDSGSNWPDLAAILSINGPSLSRETIDTTNMDTSNAKSYMAASLYEPGEITLDIAYAPGATPHDAMTSALTGATDYDWKVTFSDTSTHVAASGFVTAFEPSADLDGQLTASITIKLNGAITITGA